MVLTEASLNPKQIKHARQLTFNYICNGIASFSTVSLIIFLVQ